LPRGERREKGGERRARKGGGPTSVRKPGKGEEGEKEPRGFKCGEKRKKEYAERCAFLFLIPPTEKQGKKEKRTKTTAEGKRAVESSKSYFYHQREGGKRRSPIKGEAGRGEKGRKAQSA